MKDKFLMPISFEEELWLEKVFIYPVEKTLNDNQIDFIDFFRLCNCIIGIDDKFLTDDGFTLNLTERIVNYYISDDELKKAINYVLKKMLEVKDLAIKKEYFELTHNITLLLSEIVKGIHFALHSKT